MIKCPIITVVPTTAGVGCKFMATAIAGELSREDNKRRVALVDFDFYEPYLAHSLTSTDKVHNLDNLVTRIDGGNLTNELFEVNMVKVKGLFDVLKGTESVGTPYHFTEDHIVTILERLKKNYDYIVVAISPYNDNAGTIYGLLHADAVVMVTQNNQESKERFTDSIENTLSYIQKDTPHLCVFNMCGENADSEFVPVLQTYSDIRIAGYMPFVAEAYDNLNLKQGFGMLKKRSNEYQNSITNITTTIIKAIEESEL